MNHEEENNPFNSEPTKFGLPEGYFQKSAGSIFNKVEWLEEHKPYPLLRELNRKPAFQVPEDYFTRQAGSLELLHTPRLFSLGKQQAFTVPENYFEELEIRELAKVMDAEEARLDFIPRQNNFKVDATYFSDNEKQLHTLLLGRKAPARVIRLFRPKAWMAIAAMLLLAAGLWLYDFYFIPATSGDCGTMACIDKQELLKSKALESLESDELYDLVNSKKLEEKLENKANKPQDGKQADSSHKKSAVSDELLDEI